MTVINWAEPFLKPACFAVVSKKLMKTIGIFGTNAPLLAKRSSCAVAKIRLIFQRDDFAEPLLYKVYRIGRLTEFKHRKKKTEHKVTIYRFPVN